MYVRDELKIAKRVSRWFLLIVGLIQQESIGIHLKFVKMLCISYMYYLAQSKLDIIIITSEAKTECCKFNLCAFVYQLWLYSSQIYVPMFRFKLKRVQDIIYF